MKCLRIIIIIISFSILFLTLGEVQSIEPNHYLEGEKHFIYIAKKLGISVLRATIKITPKPSQNGKSFLHIQVDVNSFPNIAFLFKMNNRFISIVDAETLSPVSYTKEIDQDGLFIKKKHYKQTNIFNHSDQKIIIEKIQENKKEEILLPPSTYDPLSMFLRCHLMDEFKPGEDIRLLIYDGVKLREMVFQSKRETMKFNEDSEINTICLESKTSFSTFGEKEGTIRVWYTLDNKRVPILMELSLPIGKVIFELEEMKEFKNKG